VAKTTLSQTWTFQGHIVDKLNKNLRVCINLPTLFQTECCSEKYLDVIICSVQKTRIGVTVNSFRKSCSAEKVVTLAKNLIKDWKKLLPGTDSGIMVVLWLVVLW
jgi:TFIIS helical bundle-like domain